MYKWEKEITGGEEIGIQFISFGVSLESLSGEPVYTSADGERVPVCSTSARESGDTRSCECDGEGRASARNRN